MPNAKFLIEATHRSITAEHFKEDGKFMIWYHKAGKYDYDHSIGFVQVRGIKEPLTEDELKTHIDKMIERAYRKRTKNESINKLNLS